MSLLRRISQHLRDVPVAMRAIFGRRRKRAEPIADAAGLRDFLNTRASYVAQFSLYGYLRTRTGVRFPELFDDDVFVRSINIAKWHLWLACLSDLSVYAGGLAAARSGAPKPEISRLLLEAVDAVLAEVGTPADADDAFTEHAARVRARVALADWGAFSDDESGFTESPAALVRYAPVTDELKNLDEAIVRNSVRFRWQDVRRDLRRDLDVARLLAHDAE